MTTQQAGWTSWDEFILRKEGKEQEERQEWERARWMMYLAMQMHPNIKKHQKPTTPQGWIPFPWERKPKAQDGGNYEPLTEEELTGLCDLFKIDRENLNNG